MRQKRDGKVPELAKRCTPSVRDGPYFVGERGEWQPGLMPTRCPMAPTEDGPCQICLDHRRRRKTGPEFPIAVLACSTHDIRFTLYPSGHVPYGRERVVAVTPAGDAVSAPAPASDKATPAPDWTRTRFAAVADAAAGNLWPRSAPGARRATQLSHVDDASRLLSVHGGAAAVQAEVSRLVDIAHLVLREVADALVETDDATSRARQLMPLLDRAAAGRRGLERVLALGARAGLWGTVHLWSQRSGNAEPFRRLFPGIGMPSG